MDTKIIKMEGIYLSQTSKFEDERGVFFEIFNRNKFNYDAEKIVFIQENYSRSKKNVLRGLHFQNPNPQSKLITVLNGKILDVAIDIRPNSKTYGKVFSIELSKKNKTSLFIPKGFAHGLSLIHISEPTRPY